MTPEVLRKYIVYGSMMAVSLILTFLSMIVPKKKGFYLFGSGDGHLFKGNTKYLFLHLRSKNAVFYTKNKRVCERLAARGYRANHNLLKQMAYLLRAEVIFIESNAFDVSPFFYLFGNFTIVQTWHGIPFKRIALDSHHNMRHDKTYRFLNPIQQRSILFICSTNPESQAHKRSAFGNRRVCVTGYPRNDVLFRSELRFDNWEKTLNLNSYSRVFLYAPTFRKENDSLQPFDTAMLTTLNAHLKKNNHVLLLKKHPKSGKIAVSTFDHIIDLSQAVEDIQELLIYTHVLISDYSGVIFDYALLERPIIFYPYDYDFYLNECRDAYYDYFDTFPGPFARTQEELLTLFTHEERYWFDANHVPQKMRAFNHRFNDYRDGKSCDRVFGTLKSMIG